MSFDNLSPEELQFAQRQISRYGERAGEIVNELLTCAMNNDHHGGGRLVREMYDEPDKLMLVIGLLTSAVVKGVSGPLATPEQLGIDTDEPPEPWQVGAGDQMRAAAESQDLQEFARIALEAQIRASANDYTRHYQDTGHYPDSSCLLRAFLILDRITVMALATEALHRLVMLEVGDG